MVSSINRESARILTSTDFRYLKVRTNTTEQSLRKHISWGTCNSKAIPIVGLSTPFHGFLLRPDLDKLAKEAATIPPLESSKGTVRTLNLQPFRWLLLTFPLHGAMALLGLSQSSTKPSTVRGEFFSEWWYGTM